MYSKVSRHIAEGSPEKFPLHNSYFFVWSGLLSHTARIQAARDLNRALNKLVKGYNRKPIITILGHSHGGNVALNLAKIPDEKNYVIDTLILLAMPVQVITKDHAEDDTLFKEVYSFHSHGDIIQVGDPQGIFLPQRKKYRNLFTNHKKPQEIIESIVPLFSHIHFSKESRVKQIELRCGPFTTGHLHFVFPDFTKQLGKILDIAKKHDFSKKEMVYQLGWWNFIKTLFGKV